MTINYKNLVIPVKTKYEVASELFNYLEFHPDTKLTALEIFASSDWDKGLVGFLKQSPIGEEGWNDYDFGDDEPMTIISLNYPDLDEPDHRVICVNHMGVTVWKTEEDYKNATEDGLLFESYYDLLAYEE